MYFRLLFAPKWHARNPSARYWYLGECGVNYDEGECETREAPPPKEDTCKRCIKKLSQAEEE